MTREEVENCIVNTLFECTHSGEDDTISDKEFAEVLADKFINHEADLLKEFVEWLKYEYAREEHFEMEEAKDCQQKEYTYLYEYHRGREAMAEKIRDMLDQDLEKFMEERKQ